MYRLQTIFDSFFSPKKNYSYAHFLLTKYCLVLYLAIHFLGLLLSPNLFQIAESSYVLLWFNLFLSALILIERVRSLACIILFFTFAYFLINNIVLYGVNDDVSLWFLLLLAIVPRKANGLFNMPNLLFWGTWIMLGCAYSASGVNKIFMSSLWIRGEGISAFLEICPFNRLNFLNNISNTFFAKILSWILLILEAAFFPMIFFKKGRILFYFGMTTYLITLLLGTIVSEVAFVFLIVHIFIFDESWFS